MKLAETRAERDLQDSLAEIFSIIVTLDELERAFLKDAIPESDYTDICERSLKQYKSILADDTVAKAFVGLEEFKAEWDVSYNISIRLATFLRTHSDTARSAKGNREAESRYAFHSCYRVDGHSASAGSHFRRQIRTAHLEGNGGFYHIFRRASSRTTR